MIFDISGLNIFLYVILIYNKTVSIYITAKYPTTIVKMKIAQHKVSLTG